MMLDTAKTKREQAMQSLEKIGQKRKLLTDKQHNLTVRKGYVLSSKCQQTKKEQS